MPIGIGLRGARSWLDVRLIGLDLCRYFAAAHFWDPCQHGDGLPLGHGMPILSSPRVFPSGCTRSREQDCVGLASFFSCGCQHCIAEFQGAPTGEHNYQTHVALMTSFFLVGKGPFGFFQLPAGFGRS